MVVLINDLWNKRRDAAQSTSWSRQEKVYESEITVSVLALSHGMKFYAVNLSSPGTTAC